MPRRCNVCAHAERDAIDSALASGVSIRRIAEQHGLSGSSVQRHATAHVRQRIANEPALQSAPAEKALTIRDCVLRHVEKLEAAIDRASAAGQIQNMVSAMRTMYLILERTGLIDKPDEPLTSIGGKERPPGEAAVMFLRRVMDDFANGRFAEPEDGIADPPDMPSILDYDPDSDVPVRWAGSGIRAS